MYAEPESVRVKRTLLMQHTAQHEMLPTQQAQPTLVSLETRLFQDFEIFHAILKILKIYILILKRFYSKKYFQSCPCSSDKSSKSHKNFHFEYFFYYYRVL